MIFNTGLEFGKIGITLKLIKVALSCGGSSIAVAQTYRNGVLTCSNSKRLCSRLRAVLPFIIIFSASFPIRVLAFEVLDCCLL